MLKGAIHEDHHLSVPVCAILLYFFVCIDRADVYSVGAVAFEMLTRRGVWSYPRVREEIDNANKTRGGKGKGGNNSGKIEEDEYLKRQAKIRDFDKCEHCLDGVHVLPDAQDFLSKVCAIFLNCQVV